MKKIAFIFFFCSSVLFYGQNSSRIDSLRNLITTTSLDSMRGNRLILLAWELRKVNPDSAIMVSRRGIEVFNRGKNIDEITKKYGITRLIQQMAAFNYLKGEYDTAKVYYFDARKKWSELLNYVKSRGEFKKHETRIQERISSTAGNIAVLYASRGEYKDALQYFSEALRADEARGDSAGMARNYGNIGITYYTLDKYPQALEYSLKSLKINEAKRNKDGVAANLSSLGNLYRSLHENEKALDYYNKSIAAYEAANDEAGKAAALGSLGNIYRDKREFEKALGLYFEGLRIQEAMRNKRGIANISNSIATTYSIMKDYENAIKYYNKTLEIQKALGNKDGIESVLGNIGASLYEQHKYSEARKYILESLTMSKSDGKKARLKDSYLNLARTDSALGRFADAYNNFRTYVAYRDSSESEENIKKITQLEMQYNFDKQRMAEKAENDRKAAVEKEQKRKQSIILLSVAIVLVIVLIFALFMVRAYKVKQKANEQILCQKQVIEEKQKEILDSIYYARRIQRSLLPRESYVEKHLRRLAGKD